MMPRLRKVKPVPTVAALRASALKGYKTSFYINGVFFVLYTMWFAFNVWETVHLSPWHGLNAAFTLCLTLWFGIQARRTLKKYVDLKEEYERDPL